MIMAYRSPVYPYINITCNFQESFIMKTSLFNYTENFTTNKWKFSDKNSDIFHIFAQKIDCRYSLEPPRRGGSNEYHNLCFEQK